jgi:DNA-binding transcriptional MerR regulator
VEIGTKKEKGISLADLADESGIPARTIRFYIARGLLPSPQKAGRGATYGKDHRKRLEDIKRLQARGLTLNEIARSLGERTLRVAGAPQPSAWWQYPIADDVVVSVRADVSPWRLREIQKAVREMAVKLQKITGPGEQKSSRRPGHGYVSR